MRPRMRFVLYECMPKDPADPRSDDSIDRKAVKYILEPQNLTNLIKTTISYDGDEVKYTTDIKVW